MAEMPSPMPPAPQPNGGGKARLLGAVALGAIIAAGAMMLIRPPAPSTPTAGTPATSAPKEAAAPPKPAVPAPVLHSEALGDVEISSPFGSGVAKGVKTVKSSQPKDVVLAALKGDIEALGKLDAEAITADSLIWTQPTGSDGTGTTTYENLEARDIKAGVIGRLTIARSVSAIRPKDRPGVDVTLERLSVQALDAPLMRRWYTEADPEGKAPFKPLHGPYTIASGRIDNEHVSGEIGAISLTTTRVRPARRPLGTILTEIRAKAEAQKAEKDGAGKDKPAETPAVDETALLIDMIDLLTSFEFGDGAIDGIRIKAKAPKDDGPSAGEVRKAAFSGSGKPRLALEGLSVTGADGSLGVGTIASSGDLASLLMMGAEKAIRARAGTPKPKDEELRALLKARTSATPLPDVVFALEGVNGDFPAEKGKPAAGRVQFALKRFSLTSGGFVSLTPTRLDYVIEGLDVPMPKESREAGVIALREMGIERLGLSARLSAAWAEASQTFSLSELSVDMDKLARVAVNGEVGNVPRAFFEDPQRNWPSAMGASINSLVVDIQNRGGLAKLVDVAAREQKKTGEQMRKELAGIAPLVLAGMLAGHPDAGKVAQAVSNFLLNLNGARVKVTASGPNGIVLTDLMAAGENPAAFVQKLRIEAEGK